MSDRECTCKDFWDQDPACTCGSNIPYHCYKHCTGDPKAKNEAVTDREKLIRWTEKKRLDLLDMTEHPADVIEEWYQETLKAIHEGYKDNYGKTA